MITCTEIEKDFLCDYLDGWLNSQMNIVPSHPNGVKTGKQNKQTNKALEISVNEEKYESKTMEVGYPSPHGLWIAILHL